MNKSKYNVQILVDGKPVKEYTKDGKVFVEAKFGTEYSVRVKNNSGKRALAIISIDGINIITGKVANPTDTGYVINTWSSIEVEGYRKDSEGGGRFKFTEKESGYSKEVDTTGVNSGVIGVLVVEEKDPIVPIIINNYPLTPAPFRETYPWDQPWGETTWYSTTTDALLHPESLGSERELCSIFTGQNGESGMLRSHNLRPTENTAAVNFCQTVGLKNIPEAKFDAATTWGSTFNQKVTYTGFERSSVSETLEIFYAQRTALKAMGVINDTPPAINFPQSFPGFASPPTNWKG